MFRSFLLSVLTGLLLMAMGGSAMAHPTIGLDPTLPADATFAATDNIDYLGRFPEHAGTAGGTRLGDVYYVTDPRGIYTYDVSGDKAAAPELLGSLVRFQTTTGAALAQEDPDTDGNILLVDSSANPFTGAALTVVDVSDPSDLSVLATVPVTDHTWECATGMLDTGQIAGCAYAFGRTGHIIDLTDPAEPEKLDYTWRQIVGYGDTTNSPYTHDLTEIRPGLVMSAGSTAILMDTSSLLDGDATGIREITRIDESVHGHRFSSLGYHSVEWVAHTDGRLDDILVAGTEIAPNGDLAGTDCDGSESVIETYDASAVAGAIAEWEAGTITFAEMKSRAAFAPVDSFDAAGRGLYVDGNAPAHVLYCAHWMEFSPSFDGGGMLATSYYDRGTRFVPINADGTFGDESAWIVPLQGYSGSVQWVTEDVLFIHDYTRGMEVIRLGGEATGTYESATATQILTSSFVPASSFHADGVGPAAILLLGFGLLVIETRRRKTARR
ncbi:hypothetical protein [Euzebya pacifica]|uniref:hypothetical protein n=1 Tax=Euzebya pacifica TaxID=1608957 RepID=UPI0030F95EA8